MQIIQSIQNRIYRIRGERVILDSDLAQLYEVKQRSQTRLLGVMPPTRLQVFNSLVIPDKRIIFLTFNL